MKKIIDREVVIIGGGLTALCTALFLKKKGVGFIVLEKDSEPGGVIKTCSEDGFVYETGPNTGVDSRLEVGEVFKLLAGRCEIEFADKGAKRRLIWKGERWNALPQGLIQGINTPLFTFRDKLGMLLEPFRSRGGDSMESLASMVRRRLGESFLDYAVDPFISGIYAGDPEDLVTSYALPRLYLLEQHYGSFIVGAVRKKLSDKGPRPSKKVFSAAGGLSQLVRALEEVSGRENFVYNISALNVQRGKNNQEKISVDRRNSAGSQGAGPGNNKNAYYVRFISGGKERIIRASSVVSTLGAHCIRGVFDFINEDDICKISGLKYAPVVQVVLGYKDWNGIELNAFGGLVPSSEKREILGVLFPSAFLRKRAPAGGALLNVFLGGVRSPGICELSDRRILEITSKEVMEMMQLPEFKPGLVRIFRYRNAIPQYNREYPEVIETIRKVEKENNGLLLGGNIRGGIGMSDRMVQAKQMAERITSSRNSVKTKAIP